MKTFLFFLESIVGPLLIVFGAVQNSNHEPSPTFISERYTIHKSLSVTHS